MKPDACSRPSGVIGEPRSRRTLLHPDDESRSAHVRLGMSLCTRQCSSGEIRLLEPSYPCWSDARPLGVPTILALHWSTQCSTHEVAPRQQLACRPHAVVSTSRRGEVQGCTVVVDTTHHCSVSGVSQAHCHIRTRQTHESGRGANPSRSCTECPLLRACQHSSKERASASVLMNEGRCLTCFELRALIQHPLANLVVLVPSTYDHRLSRDPDIIEELVARPASSAFPSSVKRYEVSSRVVTFSMLLGLPSACSDVTIRTYRRRSRLLHTVDGSPTESHTERDRQTDRSSSKPFQTDHVH